MLRRFAAVAVNRALWATLLVCGAVALLHNGVPLYDGIGFPDEPYRYVEPPAGTRSPPPAAVSEMLQAPGGSNPSSAYVKSSEQGPQVSLFFPEKSLSAAGASYFVITVSPRPAAILPLDGSVAGNVYRFSAAASSSAAVTYSDPHGRGAVELRLPQGISGKPVIEYLAAGSGKWYQLETTQTGTDIFRAGLSGQGDYAMVIIDPGKTPSYSPERAKALEEAGKLINGQRGGQPAGKQGSGAAIGGLAALLVFIIIIIVIIRRSSHSNTPPGSTKPRHKR